MSVRYRGNLVGFDATMPTSTSRRHESPAKGDTQSAIEAAMGGCLDINEQVIWLRFKVGGHWVRLAIPVSGHWGTLGRDGYTHTFKGRQRGARKLTRAEKRLSYQQWVDRYDGTTADLNAVCKRGWGRRRGHWDHPMTWWQQVTHANRVGTILTPELKSQAFATNPAVAAHMVEVCRRFDYPLWTMALLNMKRAAGKCAQIRRAGGQFALIFGRFRHLARGSSKVAGWPVKPTRIWGPKSARQWLRS